MSKRTRNSERNSEINLDDLSTGLKIIVAKNPEQQIMMDTIESNMISFVKGAAGSGKTLIAIHYAMREFVNKRCEKIVLTRPVVEAAGEKIGFLPGDISDKIDPYMLPIFELLSQIVAPDLIPKLLKNGKESIIRVIPLAFMRGLAQPLDAHILTPSGFRKMGDISLGDHVIGQNGQPTKVIGVFPQGRKTIYKIEFDDRTSTECCGDHLWLTKTLSEKRHKKESIKTTKQILATISNGHQKNHCIPMAMPVVFKSQNVPIDPYLLGLLLGDGSLHKEASITITSADEEIINSVSTSLPENMEVKYASQYDYRLISHKCRNPLKRMIQDLGLLGTMSHNKFIPDVYKINSIQVRLEILRGLLDTDGSIFRHRSGRCRIQFYSKSEMLVDDVAFLVRSLGGTCRKRLRTNNKKNTINGRQFFSTYLYVLDIIMPCFNPFRLSRKAKKYQSPSPTKLIKSITEVGVKECQCIKVENSDGLYLTNDFIVTHNTFANSVVICDEAQNTTPDQLRMLLTRIGENSKMILCGDIRQSDIERQNGLEDAFDLLTDIEGIGFVTLTANAIVRHPVIGKIEERYEQRARTGVSKRKK